MKFRTGVPTALLLALVVFASVVFPQMASAQVTLTFYMLTAPHAALGAPMQFQITLTNTGTTSVTLTDKVNLIDPSSNTYNLLTSMPTLAPGQVLGTPGTFTTSTFTTATGSFSLQAMTIDSSGHLLMTKTLPLTVVPVPTNGVYGSIGGRGPDAGQIGYTYDFSTVVMNLGTTSISLQTQVILTLTDGTVEIIKPGGLTNYNPGSNIINPLTVTTSQFSAKTGTYSVIVNVLDSGANILSTDTHSFTRTSLPTGFLSTFKDKTQAGIDQPRTQPTLPPGCGTFPDFNAGNSGAAIADYDSDGFEDIFVAGEAGDNHLWHNNHNATYTDVAATAGIPLTATASVSGASFADIDNDGHPDLLLLGGPQAQNILLHNNGDGTFTDISATAGLTEAVPQNNFSATWGDYDNDGFLDLFIAVHADCSGKNSGVHLYHNNKNNTFTEVTQFLGTTKVNGRGLTAVFLDYNQDGRVDIFLGNDQGSKFGANAVWRNDGSDGNGGWIFTDVSATSGAGLGLASMGIGVGDFNRDGQFDIYLSNFSSSPNPLNNILLAGSSAGTFLQVQGDQQGGAHAKRATVPCLSPPGGQAASVTWGTGMYDFNNDGWEDIWMAGSGAGANGCTEIQDNTTILMNLKGIFLDLGGPAGLTGANTAGTSPTAVFTDFNNDGFMDVFQAPSNGLEHLYVNQIAPGNTNHWLQVKLVGTVSNRDAIGARLVASVGGVNLLRTVINGATYQGNSTLIQQFGLGASTQADTLTIFWPSGMVQVLTNVTGNQRMTITEP